jgi:hypothetical protein
MNELSADAQASRPRAVPRLLRPSQVPVSGSAAGLTGRSSLTGRGMHVGRRLRPSGALLGGAAVPARPSAVPARLVAEVLRGSGQPLAAPLKEDMQARLGADFSHVRVHTDATARASAAELGARAYTLGNHVVIGDGGADKHTLAHELTHVIQQSQGPVAGTDHGNGLKVSNPSDHFEREAAANAARAISGPTTERSTGQASTRPDSASAAGRDSAIQRAIPPGDLQIEAAHPDGYKRFSPNGLHDDSATSMQAQLHPGHLEGGSGVGGSKPGWTPEPWPVAGTAGISPDTVDFFRRNMVQAHLLNEDLGGPGTRENLTPLSKAGNRNHFEAAERQIKTELDDGNIVQYEVEVNYGISGRNLLGSSAATKPAVVTDIDNCYRDKIAKDVSAEYAVYENDGTRKYGAGWFVDGRGA